MEKKKNVYKYMTNIMFLICLNTHNINMNYSESHYTKQRKMVFVNGKGVINSCLGDN